MDRYRTIKGEASAKLVRKGSRFIALAYPVGGPEEIQEYLEKIRRRYHDATHYCYAYRLLAKDGVLAHSDDGGEPARSAGPPILQALEAQDLLNTLVVVVRYFGGAKLGIGGLIRAYGDAASEALAQAEIITQIRKERLRLCYPPELTGEVLRVVNQYRAEIEEQDYAEGARLAVSLPTSQAEGFRRAVREATSGRVEFREPCE